ncbi:TPA: flagellar basal body P-ring formation chaperone FlgA [Yersinia enterocolitica]|uniref:Flagella basal body P-ring formation protein FlgA n=2 Tax=Yersinia enterocolitica TaxID=630 RepID=FLGA_YEREN|nr:flagellar basal body P-ring formation chaperone FlgA [Yersinia enterocolitica]Q56892.1 RecName: Full=Flagella basal body P-ring formation protein FlgA; Flags: Precursor [Yersinia enterocolitica]AJJ28215.1 flagella basal body P-ring formation protein FlgA [Yersinia enterocolitica]ALG78341.1 flagellar basal body P-ring biosynthesis protein FlgA [Yersinia enterocolitica]KGA70325.1 flagella basal body P-ring formation protein FlgA [Yersinia enterocolitica]MDA5485278.1 flagellar basal body P-rin
MNRNGVITCALGGLLLSQAATHQAMAADLSVQVNQFFQQQYPDKESQVKVVIKTPQNQWPQCDMPEITLPANARPWGNISLSVRCDGVRRFIQTQVQVSGHYAVAARQLAAGEKMTLQDIKMKQGRLDTLPPGALLEPNFAQGAVSLRQINAGQPLTRNMLRRLWIIKAGQDVQVLALGEGFNVNSNGKAMNNAAIQDNVRVRMASGQIVSGTVADDGTVHILL